MMAPAAARAMLLGRKRRRGRKPQAGPAWEFHNFDIRTPEEHPQQNPQILAGVDFNAQDDILNEL